MAHGERRVVRLGRPPSYEHGLMFRTQAVNPHESAWRGNTNVMTARVLRGDETVGTLGPFERNVRPAERLTDHKLAVEVQALLLQYPHGNLNAGLAQHVNATPADFGERVTATDHHTRYAFTDNQVCTRRCAALVGTRLQADV